MILRLGVFLGVIVFALMFLFINGGGGNGSVPWSDASLWFSAKFAAVSGGIVFAFFAGLHWVFGGFRA